MPIRLTPNTGYHFFFLPFGKVEDSNGQFAAVDPTKTKIIPLAGLPSDIEKVSANDSASWMPYQHPFTGEKSPWLLWHPGTKEEPDERGNPTSILGIWTCVETNLGNYSRGTKLCKTENIKPEVFHSADYPSPYYAPQENSPNIDHRRVFTFPFAWPNDTPFQTSQIPVAPAPVGEDGQPTVPAGWALLQELRICWADKIAPEPWDVDLVVDFGNSRSVAVLLTIPRLHAASAAPPLSTLISSLRMMPREEEYARFAKRGVEDPLAIFDSWFLTRQTLFSALQPPNLQQPDAMKDPTVETVGRWGFNQQTKVTQITRRIPQMFMQMSPCIIGQDAKKVLSGASLLDRTCFLSSPKRYLWDDDALPNGEWGMIPDPHAYHGDAGTETNPKLAAHVLSFMPFPFPPNLSPVPPEDYEWTMENPPLEWEVNKRPLARPNFTMHSRSDTMIWVALAVLEQAHRQISSPSNVTADQDHQLIRRRLRHVVVTFPPGWTGKELQAYKKKWNTAINIFALSNLEHPRENRPKLLMECDEALGAQLPLVFSEIERMGRNGRSWLDMVGRRDPMGMPKARVMSIDVGGGTTDYAIFEYEDQLKHAGVQLVSTLLFKDSSTIAGDQLVLKLIEEVLLARLGERFRNQPDKFEIFQSLFRESGNSNHEWRRIVRLLFIPRVNLWLSNWGQGIDPEPDSGPYQENDSAMKTLCKFANAAGLEGNLWSRGDHIPCSKEDLDLRVREIFHPLFETLAKIVSVFDVDLIILSGKPSELPGVCALLNEVMPILPCRIITVKGHPIGSWYPYQVNGKIYDAKTVTACGVALFQAISTNGLVPNWAPIQRQYSLQLLRENCWIQVLGEGENPYDALILLDNGAHHQFETDSALLEVQMDMRIGRSMLKSLRNVEPVYILAWKKKTDAERLGKATVKIRVRRKVPPPETGLPEYLELFHLDPIQVEGTAVTLDMIHLKLCTLIDTAHWIDAPAFHVS